MAPLLTILTWRQTTQVHELLTELKVKLLDLGVVEGNDEEGYHPHPGTFPTVYAQAYLTGLDWKKTAASAHIIQSM